MKLRRRSSKRRNLSQNDCNADAKSLACFIRIGPFDHFRWQNLFFNPAACSKIRGAEHGSKLSISSFSSWTMNRAIVTSAPFRLMTGAVSPVVTSTGVTTAPPEVTVEGLRRLTGIFFEYMMPNQRHQTFLPRSKLIREKGRYHSKTFLKGFQREYSGKQFQSYWDRNLFTHTESRSTEASTLDNSESLSPKDVPFKLVISELRRSSALIDWIYVGNRGDWLGNKHLRYAALMWLKADDAVRRRFLRDTDLYKDNCPAVQAYLKAIGKDYKMRINKRIKDLSFRCQQSFRVAEHIRHTNPLNFQMARVDAAYMIRLYDLPHSLDESAIAAFDSFHMHLAPERNETQQRTQTMDQSASENN
jgi:hypothetical protein